MIRLTVFIVDASALGEYEEGDGIGVRDVLLHPLGHNLSILHVVAIEPEATKGGQNPGLDELDPSSLQLHNDGEWRVAAEDPKVNHARMVGHPNPVDRRHRLGAVELDDCRPGHEEAMAQGLGDAKLKGSPGG